MTAARSSALVIGASRGLGLGFVEAYLRRGWQVVATVRGESPALARLAEEFPGALTVVTVDINVPDDRLRLRRDTDGRTFDHLVMNAGICLGQSDDVREATRDDFVQMMLTNAFSPTRMIATMEGQVREGGVIVAISSDLGSIALNDNGAEPFYRASKAALNSLLRSLSVTGAGGRRYLCVSPGKVRTDMGGPNAALSVEESVRGMLDAVAAGPADGAAKFINYAGADLPW